MSWRTFFFGERVVEPQQGYDHRLRHDRMHRIQDRHENMSLRAGAALLGQRVRSEGDSEYDGESAHAAISAQRGRAKLDITHHLDPDTHVSTTTHRRTIQPSGFAARFWGEAPRTTEVKRTEKVVTDHPGLIGRLRGEKPKTRIVGTETRKGSVRAERDWQKHWRRATWNERAANGIARWFRDREQRNTQRPTNGGRTS